MSDQLAARIRTVWPLVLGHVAAVIVAWVFAKTGVQLDGVVVLELLSFVASWLIWEAGTWLQVQANPVLQGAGRWLVAAGQDIGKPTYPELPPGPAGDPDKGDRTDAPT
jgi:hypothetical protein